MSLSLAAVLQAAAETAPGETYLRTSSGELTFADLDRRTRDAAASLLAAGRRPGDTVPVCCDGEGPDWVIQAFGAARIGVVVQLSSLPAEPGDLRGSPSAPHTSMDREPAEEAIWSETTAVIDTAGRRHTHGELVHIGLVGALQTPLPTDPDALFLAAVTALVRRRELG